MRIINFFDGAQSETTPTIGNIVASSLVPYADDATYEANEQGAPAEGNVYFNTTDKTIRYYNGTTWQELIDENTVQAVENKAIDADNNMITNIDNNEIKALAGIEATKIADGSVTDAEFQYIGGLTSDAQTQINSKQSTSEKDQPNGYAGLDGSGKILASVVPDSFLQYKGVWNASTNTPTLIDGTGTQGDVYRVSVAGTQDLGSGSQVFAQGDWVTYSGTIWERSDFTGATSISDLTDVDTTGVTDGQFLQYNNGAGEWQPDDISIDELSDVDTVSTAPTIGQALVWDGSTDWVPGTIDPGSSEINYIDGNPDAETNTGGWASFDDGAVAAPVDGTGGSPTQSGFLRSTILPLRGTGSFLISNQGGDAQGEGVSYDFSIERADEGNRVKIAFDYNTDTSNFVTGDVGVYVYDVTNATMTKVTSEQSGDIEFSSALSSRFLGSFITSSTSLSYRLVFHIQTTNANNWSLRLDTVVVGPESDVVCDYLESEVSSNIKTVSADTYVDSGATITLSPGTWDLGYHASLFMANISGGGDISGNAAIRDGANNVIPRTAQLISMTMGTVSNVGACTINTSSTARITITASTTYKLSCRCSVANTLDTVQILAPNFTGLLTDPDTSSFIWARRIK